MIRAFLLLCLLLVAAHATDPHVDPPADPLRSATVALREAAAGDVTALRAAQQRYAAVWPTIEDGIRGRSKTAYAAIEEAMGDLAYALEPDSLDLDTARAAAKRLAATTEPLLAPAPAVPATPHAADPAPAALTTPTTAGAPATPTLATVIARAGDARTALAAGDYDGARAAVRDVRQWWPDAEAAVKTRDGTAYRACEDLMARAAAQLAAGDARADATLATLIGTMQPFAQGSNYGVFDAFIILLREGVEALLVIAALLTFLGRSGQRDKQRWIWGGAVAGVAVSLVLALTINLLFKAAFRGADRELLEGVIGLVAAGLLFWVSWWLHRAANLSRWNAAIADRTQSALATGSVVSLAALAFLAVLREGAETALFLLGMAPSIATGDLLLGLGLGAAALAVVAVVFVLLGARLPLRPFFAVLGLLVLAMGIKFVGAGVQALQVAQWLPASVVPGLPSVELLGFFPTWETIAAQLAAIALVAGLFAVGNWYERRARLRLAETPEAPTPASTGSP